jgi:hypothetical protein
MTIPSTAASATVTKKTSQAIGQPFRNDALNHSAFTVAGDAHARVVPNEHCNAKHGLA